MNITHILNVMVLFNNIFVSVREKSWISLIVILLFVIFILFVLFIICSFYILKWLNKRIDYDYFLDDFCKETKNNFEKYGDIELKEIYLAKKPINRLQILLLNIISGFKFNSELDNYLKTIHPIVPSHTSIICKIRLPDKQIKIMQLEKINKIQFTDNFKLTNDHELYKIKLKERKSINDIINITRKRMGDPMFFKWSLTRNNCQKFVKELLVSIDSFDEKFNDILIGQEGTEKYFSPLTLYASKFIVNFYNMFQYMITYMINY